MIEIPTLALDWKLIGADRKAKYHDLNLEPRQLIVEGLSSAMRTELSALVMTISISIKRAGINFSDENPDLSQFDIPVVKMEMLHFFEEQRQLRGGNLVSLLPESEIIESAFDGYRIEQDIVTTIGAVNTKIKHLNTLQGYDYGEFFIGSRQVLSLIESLKDSPEHTNGNGFRV